MTCIHIDNLDDDRLADYRQLKDRELAREGGRFVAQGEAIVRRLLASNFAVDSVLVAEPKVAAVAPLVPEGVPVYCLSSDAMDAVLGFRFYSNVMAVGRRRPEPTLAELFDTGQPRQTVLVIPEVINHENLGAMIRSAAAFGLDAVLLGPQCHDPFWRRSIRVSMGATFALPIRRCEDLAADMRTMRDRWRYTFAAAVVHDDATALPRATRTPRTAIVMGHEWDGIAPHWQSLCDQQVTLPMAAHTDSLNVAMATAVFLYHYTQQA